MENTDSVLMKNFTVGSHNITIVSSFYFFLVKFESIVWISEKICCSNFCHLIFAVEFFPMS